MHYYSMSFTGLLLQPVFLIYDVLLKCVLLLNIVAYCSLTTRQAFPLTQKFDFDGLQRKQFYTSGGSCLYRQSLVKALLIHIEKQCQSRKVKLSSLLEFNMFKKEEWMDTSVRTFFVNFSICDIVNVTWTKIFFVLNIVTAIFLYSPVTCTLNFVWELI